MKKELLHEFLKEAQKLEIRIGDNIYRLSTKLKFLMKVEKNYKHYIEPGERTTFLKVFKNNFGFIIDLLGVINNIKDDKEDDKEDYKTTKITTLNLLLVALDDILENVDLYALSVIIYSLIDDENLSFQEFQELDLIQFIDIDFKNILKEIYKDLIEDDDDTKKKKVI